MDVKRIDDKEFKKQLEKYKRTSLSIQRIPEKTKTRFMQVAKEEFSNDYGMYVKWLQDFRDGILEHPNTQLQTQIDLLAEEVNKLKEGLKEKKEEEPTLKAADGSVKKIGR